MRHTLLVVTAGLAAAFAQVPVSAQETMPAMVETYSALADSILSVRRAEENLVRAVLEGHRQAAVARYGAGDYGGAAAEIALFANEGDNAIAGVRKRLVAGGHHHHSQSPDENAPEFDSGFVIVNRATKASLLEAAAHLRKAPEEAAARDAWAGFMATSEALLHSE
jgi:hypothetical protein